MAPNRVTRATAMATARDYAKTIPRRLSVYR